MVEEAQNHTSLVLVTQVQVDWMLVGKNKGTTLWGNRFNSQENMANYGNRKGNTARRNLGGKGERGNAKRNRPERRRSTPRPLVHQLSSPRNLISKDRPMEHGKDLMDM